MSPGLISGILRYIFGLKKYPRFASVEPMTPLLDNGPLRKAIVHPTQFLGFEFICTGKFLLISNVTSKVLKNTSI